MQVCRGGDEISFTNMRLVAEMVLAQGVSAWWSVAPRGNFPQMLYSNLKMAELGRNM